VPDFWFLNFLGLLNYWRTSPKPENEVETSLSELLPARRNEKINTEEEIFSLKDLVSPGNVMRDSIIDNSNNILSGSPQTVTPPHDELIQPYSHEPQENLSHKKLSRSGFFTLCLDDILTILSSSWLNFGLTALPFTLLAWIFNFGDSVSFVLTYVSLIPIVRLFRISINEITKSLDSKTLQITFFFISENVPELILALIALTQGLTRLTQAFVMGIVFGRVVLVPSLCFFAIGITSGYIIFANQQIKLYSSLLFVMYGVLIVPTMFVVGLGAQVGKVGILRLSQWVAIILFLVNIPYSIFLVKTYHEATNVRQNVKQPPKFSLVCAIVWSLLAVVLLIFEALFLLRSLHSIPTSWGLSFTFLGLVVLPMMVHTSHYVTSVRAALRNRLEHVLLDAVRSSTEVCALVAPLLVLLSWIFSQTLTLHFSLFESVVVLGGILFLQKKIYDGFSSWYEGMTMIAAYLVVSIAFFFHPDL